jgi:DNA-directed RNA polymerase specialized sigma24 family protein
MVTKKQKTLQPEPTPIPPSAPPKVNYLNNKDLLAEVKRSKEKGEMTPKLANMLTLLCNRYGKRANFVNYTYNEDMQAYAMLMLVRTWNSFDPAKSDNPFAFFTQCIKHSFIQFLYQEKRQRNIRDLLMVDQGLTPSFGFMADSDEGGGASANSSSSYDDEQDYDTYIQPETVNKADLRFGNPDEVFTDDVIEVDPDDGAIIPTPPPAE